MKFASRPRLPLRAPAACAVADQGAGNSGLADPLCATLTVKGPPGPPPDDTSVVKAITVAQPASHRGHTPWASNATSSIAKMTSVTFAIGSSTFFLTPRCVTLPVASHNAPEWDHLVDLWIFQLPALRERKEDIEPNLDFELRRFLEREGRNVTFNREARERYIAFATGPEAAWSANFRDLSASVTRMGTLAPQGRITVDVVDDEVLRLKASWGGAKQHAVNDSTLIDLLGAETMAGLDLFDAAQLSAVLEVCRLHNTASSAGRVLFASSRLDKKSTNDADRVTKYLARFGLKFSDVR